MHNVNHVKYRRIFFHVLGIKMSKLVSKSYKIVIFVYRSATLKIYETPISHFFFEITIFLHYLEIKFNFS